MVHRRGSEDLSGTVGTFYRSLGWWMLGDAVFLIFGVKVHTCACRSPCPSVCVEARGQHSLSPLLNYLLVQACTPTPRSYIGAGDWTVVLMLLQQTLPTEPPPSLSFIFNFQKTARSAVRTLCAFVGIHGLLPCAQTHWAVCCVAGTLYF